MTTKNNATADKPALTAERVRELFNYDPKTGVMLRRVTRGNVMAGSVAGRPDREGYVRIDIDGREYRRARLAWLYVHGEWPKGLIDHRDGVPDNDRLANLRDVTRAQNNRNRKGHAASGLKGAYFNRRTGRWFSRITRHGKGRHLGHFPTPAACAVAFEAAARKIGHAVTARRPTPTNVVTFAEHMLGIRAVEIMFAEEAGQ